MEKELEMTSPLNTGAYAVYRFSTWDDTLNDGAAGHAREQVAWYVDTVAKTGSNWLYIAGGYGLGKTHLAVAALRKIAGTRLWKPHVVVWPELCDATRESWTASFGASEAQLWGAARAADILLIDDLDKTATSEWAMGKLFGLVNYRYVRQKPTIITANRSLLRLREEWRASKLSHIRDTGQATLSRIEGQLMALVILDGEDQRQKNANL